MIEARGAAICDVNLYRPVHAVFSLREMPCKSDRRSARAEDERLGVRVAPMIRGQERIQRVAAGPRIGSAALEFAIAFIDAADLAHLRGERFDVIELVNTRSEQIHFVS